MRQSRLLDTEQLRFEEGLVSLAQNHRLIQGKGNQLLFPASVSLLPRHAGRINVMNALVDYSSSINAPHEYFDDTTYSLLRIFGRYH
jgi:hypothetical protein